MDSSICRSQHRLPESHNIREMAAMNYDRFLSDTAKARRPQPLRLSYERMASSGLDVSQFINMAAGMPNTSLFPFVSAEFKLRDGSSLSIDGKRMEAAQQYGATSGDGAFKKKVAEFLQMNHNPPTSKISNEEQRLEFFAVPGAKCGITLSFDLILNPGDYYIVEEPTYPGALEAARPMNYKPLAVATDEKGMIPSELKKLLDRWGPEAAKDPESDIPKCLYIIPTGTNPSGVILSEKRRREIYQIAREYDLMIIEDDPYFFINFEDERPPSFLSLDVDGRVIRMDSFSKIIAAGFRLGVASGPNYLIKKLMWHLQAVMGHAPCISQVLLSELLEKWGNEGFKKQQESCRELYKQQRDMVDEYANKHLMGLAGWVTPSAGMFLWLKIHGIEDTRSFIEGSLADERVLFAPGFCFMANPDEPCQYVRVSYSNISEEKMDKGFARLAVAIKTELAKNLDGS